LPVRGNRFGDKVGEIWRFHLLEQILAIERLECRGRAGHDIDLEATGLCLAYDTLQESFRVGAPDLDLDAVFLVEGSDQSGNVIGRDRRVEGELLFLFSAFEQPLAAVGALVGRDLGNSVRLRERGRVERGGNDQKDRERHQAVSKNSLWSSHAGGAPRCGWSCRQTMAQFRGPCQRNQHAKTGRGSIQ
jgi:hypothetical protein